MSTIEKILLTLQNNSDEKKTRITNSYQEKSVWLRNEFDVIRKLIKQNPRDNLKPSEENEPVQPVAVVEVPVPSSSAPRELSNDGKKRRSPETVNDEKLSPQQKRASVDVEEIYAQAGLPSDLNRLTKAQLLDELEKRGVDSYSQKVLKGTLVDALKYHLVSEHHTRSRKDEPQVSAVDEIANGSHSSPLKSSSNAPSVAAETEESTSMVIATPSKPSASSVPASVRKISNISDIRSMVQDNLSASQTLASEKATAAAGGVEGDSEKAKKIRAESEFRNRYSSMAARKSIVVAATDAILAAPATGVAPVVESSENAPEPAVVPVEVTAEPSPKNAADNAASSASSSHPKDSLCSTDSIWMEVSSPVRAENKTASASEGAAPAPIPCRLDQQCDSASADTVSPQDSSDAAPSRARTESDASFVSCVSTGSNVPKSNVSSSTAAGNSHSSHSGASNNNSKTATTSATGGMKQGAKMTTSSSGPVKSVVPSMQKGVRLVPKTAEDQRAMLLAKKAAASTHAGDKVAAPAKPSFSTSTSAAPVSQSTGSAKTAPAPAAPAVASAAPMAVALAPAAAHVVVTSTTLVTVVPAVSQSTTAATVSSTPAATPSAAGAALSQKKSIFGTMFGSSKKNAPTPTSAGPVAALAGSGEMKKPATATSAHPAMVDAIIKSAKAAESAATALTTVPATAAKAETVAVAAKMQTPLEVKEPVSLSTSTGKPVALKDAMSSKSLISSIVSNYNNALKSGNNAVHGGDSSGPLSAAAPSTAAAAPPVLRDITTTTNASGSSVKAAPAPTAAAASVAVAATPATPSAARPVTAVAASVTPAAAAAASNVPKEYVIEDRDSSDESGTDGEGEESEEAKKKKQNIPDWARGPMLKEALERQYGLNGHTPIDPDVIFHEVTTCSLEEIFGVKEGINRKYGARSSSAHWEADQMTLVEKRSYRKHMGYDRAQQQQQQLAAGMAK